MIDQFMKHQRYRGLSRATMERRRDVLRQFQRFIEPLSLEQATAEHLEEFIGSKRAPRTKHAYRSDLRVFYAWAMSHKLVAENPALALDTIRVPKPLPRPLAPAVAATLLYFGSRPVRVMIALALFAGLRTFEIAGLDGSDVWLHSTPPTIVVRNGKGTKDRSVPIHPTLRELLAGMPTAGPLFPSRLTGRAMVPESVARAMSRHMQMGGVDATPHQLRHTFVTEVAHRSGGDMRLTADLAGHESMNTTLGYVRLLRTDGAEVIGRMFPGPDAA